MTHPHPPPTPRNEVEQTLALERARLHLENRTTGGLKAYLVAVELPEDDPGSVQDSLQELGALVRSLGDDCTGATVQKKARISPATFMGQGKAQEVRNLCKAAGVDYVVVDRDLSPSQVRNLEKILEKPTLDRTGIILQIFRKNAKTRESKTQVELAHMEYLAPRLSNAWVAFERQRGGGSGGGNRTKGAGEMQLEIDRRRLKDRIAGLKKELEKIGRERLTQRKARVGNTLDRKVVMVGYTNAGKTTLMNALTDSQLSAKNALFETLDSSVRTLKGVATPRILITDTVGFIRNLPHGLVASFRSTLSEAGTADLLLHVVDVSHPQCKKHMEVTDGVLSEIGASHVPCLYVFNKVDALNGEPRLARILARAYPNSIVVSAQKDEDIKRLRDHITQTLSQSLVEATLEVPYHNTQAMAHVYSHMRVLSVDTQEQTALFQVRASAPALEKAHQLLHPPQPNEEDITP